MPLIPLFVHMATVFQHEDMEEQNWDEYCRRNCMELSEKMRQRDATIGALQQTRSREKIIRAIAYLREIQNGDMEKLDWQAFGRMFVQVLMLQSVVSWLKMDTLY
nr:hypothetical protein [Tanacetum cinerariifolium]